MSMNEKWSRTQRSLLHYCNDAINKIAGLRSMAIGHSTSPDVTETLKMVHEARVATEYAGDCDNLLVNHCKQISPKLYDKQSNPDKFELEKDSTGEIQLQLKTKHGLVDLVFVNKEQFLELVAGQHLDVAKTVLEEIPV